MFESISRLALESLWISAQAIWGEQALRKSLDLRMSAGSKANSPASMDILTPLWLLGQEGFPIWESRQVVDLNMVDASDVFFTLGSPSTASTLWLLQILVGYTKCTQSRS